VDLVIRKMRAEDMDEVIALLARFNMAPLAPSAENPHPERTEIIVENTFVALAGGRIIGVRSFIQHSAVEAEVASVAVSPEHQDMGVAAKLADAGQAEMRARGIRKARFETDRREVVEWVVKRFGGRVLGYVLKRHSFGDPKVDRWTVVEFDLEPQSSPREDCKPGE
jgi:ribosomal protein S18 acetylase RimI-like enzyme